MAYNSPEKIRAYREAHREEARERSRRWRAEHPGENAEKARDWRKRNPRMAAETNRKWRAANRERVRATQKAWRAKNEYALSAKRKAENHRAGLMAHGMTPADYQALLVAQAGACAICASSAPRMKNAKRLYVDHDHKTDEVRGLLCFRCNSLLAAADDSSDRLNAAIAYLKHEGSGIIRGKRRCLLRSKSEC